MQVVASLQVLQGVVHNVQAAPFRKYPGPQAVQVVASVQVLQPAEPVEHSVQAAPFR